LLHDLALEGPREPGEESVTRTELRAAAAQLRELLAIYGVAPAAPAASAPEEQP
jgi:hypothetical protein